MRLCPTLYVVLLVLLEVVPLGAFGADRETHGDSVAVHRHFDTLEPFLNEPSKAVKHAISEHCQTLDLQCLEFADTHGDLMLSAVPDNPEFWFAYDSAMAADPLPVDLIEAEKLPAYQGFIDGANGWVRRELVTRQIADVVRLHAQVIAHRRRLAVSNTLIDKMIFTASTGILLPAINVHMAPRDPRKSESDQRLLDEMLHELKLDEVSLRRVMDGELRYAAARLEQLPDGNSPVRLGDLERAYGFIADRSEADWGDFWRLGLDVLADVELPGYFYMYIPSWAQYSVHVRYLDASLIVLRELREMYEGRISPGPPATQAPYGWSWRWEEESQTLCLDRGYVHESVSLEEPASVCHPYLESSPDSQ